MDRLAQIGIIISDIRSAEAVNEILHEFSEYIAGRMGLPYKKYSVMVISIVVDAPLDKINALTGRLARLPGVTAKAAYAKLGSNQA